MISVGFMSRSRTKKYKYGWADGVRVQCGCGNEVQPDRQNLNHHFATKRHANMDPSERERTIRAMAQEGWEKGIDIRTARQRAVAPAPIRERLRTST